MKNRCAFTLIELLVVVLIVGILAAIAVPQYQIAVWKSRLTAILPLMNALKDSQERYFLEHGKYASVLTDLDMQFPGNCEPWKNMWFCGDEYMIDNAVRNGESLGYITMKFCPGITDHNTCQDNRLLSLVFYYKNKTSSTSYPDYVGQIRCYSDTSQGKKICKVLF